MDHYFKGKSGRIAEELLRFPLGQVLYVNGEGSELEIKVAMDGLKFPNGIAGSNDHRLAYLMAIYLILHQKCIRVHRQSSSSLLSAINAYL